MKDPHWRKCILNADSRTVIKRIPDNSIDFILTDPPYNLAKHSTGNIPLPNRSAMNNDLADWDLVDFNPEEWANEFATYNNGRFTITNKGIRFVEKNIDSIKYLMDEGFSYDEMREAFKTIAENPKEKIIPFTEIIAEGMTVQTTNKKIRRSQKLRASAIEFYSKDGHIACDCCGFDFKNVYAPDYACECIEIHHKKPIFLYGANDLQKTIDEALQNLLPVCPNCHRVIHKMNIGSDQIPTFKSFMQTRPSVK